MWDTWDYDHDNNGDGGDDDINYNDTGKWY